MRALLLGCVGCLLLLGAGNAPPDGVLAPLAQALDEAQAHVAALAKNAANASPLTLAIPTDDEQGALSAVVDADGALDRIMHGPTAVLPRDTDIAVLAELDRAHDALASYAQARLHGNRNLMRAAAAAAGEALARADAILGARHNY
ncbi:MAG TPA: hypothetical protein VF997_14555 [Polyangia bacterium]